MWRSGVRTGVLAGCVLCLGASAGQADEKKAGVEGETGEIFNLLDKNKDGKISGDEVNEEQKKSFERLLRLGDENKDGILSKEEYGATLGSEDEEAPVKVPGGVGVGGGDLGRNMEEMLKKLDANGDGKLALSEVPAQVQGRLKPVFDRLGTDEVEIGELRKMLGGAKGLGEKGGKKGLTPGMFKRMDKNGDGRLSSDEVPTMVRERFKDAFDKGGKEGLTLEEYQAAVEVEMEGGKDFKKRGMEGWPKKGGKEGTTAIRALDTNGDGAISKDELRGAIERFGKLDRNNNGKLEIEELTAIADDEEKKMKILGDEDVSSEAPVRPNREKKRPGGGQGDRFTQMDKNGDGFVSKEEFPGGGKRVDAIFGRLDENKDGKLSPEEMRKQGGKGDE